MKLFMFFIILISSCQTNKRDKQMLSSKLKFKIDNDTVNVQSKKNDDLNFEAFIKKINTNCSFQKKSIEFPLQSISLIDFESEIYDTIYIKEKDYECVRFTSPESDITDGIITLKFIDISINEKIILLGVEDTGIHIQYFFSLKDKKWFLVKILDESI
jgi:hypothetical protein